MEKIVVCEVGKKPVIKEVDGTLESYQKILGGYIEPVYVYDDGACLLVNEEGIIRNLPVNKLLVDKDSHIVNALFGNIIVVGLGEEDFCSLSSYLADKYVEILSNNFIFV